MLGDTALCTGVWLQLGMREPQGLQISPFLNLGRGWGGSEVLLGHYPPEGGKCS